MGQVASGLKQSFFVPAPSFTEKELDDQSGRVHIVTGGYAGCGQDLSSILYSKNAVVYIAGRSKEKADRAINKIKQDHPNSKGRVEFLELDLSNLATIKPAVEKFTQKEQRLDVLTNNAGVMHPPSGSKDSHGHELQMGTNCLGPFLLSELLLPILQSTAKANPNAPPRVTWAGSLAASHFSPTNGVSLSAEGEPKDFASKNDNYAQSKGGNLLLATEFAKRYGRDGIISNAWNPGNLKTELSRHHAAWIVNTFGSLILYPSKYGAYTELYAGWSPDITLSNNGAYVVPWGRIDTPNLRPDLLAAIKSSSDGGNGTAEKFWQYCERETKAYR
ncbi:unnamed protein product [Sympodiomycopsis kandeliae]